MAKVIVERSRIPGRNNRKGRSVAFEDMPRKESMKSRHSDRKTLNENLRPLVRFLNSKVGKNWDSVYSEICENLRVSNAVQQHVRDHVWDYVQKNVMIEDGKVSAMRKYGWKFSELRINELYICPKTNILKRYKKKSKKTKRQDPFVESLKNFSSSKSMTGLNDGVYYKYFKNPVTKEWDVVHRANKTYAEEDFKYLYYQNRSLLLNFMGRFSSKINFKDEYWARIIELYNKFFFETKSLEKEPSYIGKSAEYSLDGGKTWGNGIICHVFKDPKGLAYFTVEDEGKKNIISPYIPSQKVKIV